MKQKPNDETNVTMPVEHFIGPSDPESWPRPSYDDQALPRSVFGFKIDAWLNLIRNFIEQLMMTEEDLVNAGINLNREKRDQ